jgi:hypothetical protein
MLIVALARCVLQSHTRRARRKGEIGRRVLACGASSIRGDETSVLID